MPEVVFFGGAVPPHRVNRVCEALDAASGLLVIGSSLTVYSGFRFCRYVKQLGKPLAILNRGRTRAHDVADLVMAEDCAPALERVVLELTEGTTGAAGGGGRPAGNAAA